MVVCWWWTYEEIVYQMLGQNEEVGNEDDKWSLGLCSYLTLSKSGFAKLWENFNELANFIDTDKNCQKCYLIVNEMQQEINEKAIWQSHKWDLKHLNLFFLICSFSLGRINISNFRDQTIELCMLHWKWLQRFVVTRSYTKYNEIEFIN